MKKLSYTLATLVVLGFSLFPANAGEKKVANNTTFTDATEEIMQSVQPEACIPIPFPPYVYCN